VNTGSAADLLRWRQARRSFDLRPSRQRTHQHRRGASASTSSKPGCRSSCSTQQFSVAKEDVAQQGSPTDVRIGLRRKVTRLRLGIREDSRRFADTEL